MKKVSQRIITLAVLLGIGLSVPLTTFAHGPNTNKWNGRGKHVRCERNIKWQEKLFGRFDQENTRITNRIQMLINRENTIPCMPSSDIVDTLVDNGNFTTLVAAVGAANLVDTLKSDGKFTLFAPTDQAFAKLPTGTVAALLNDLPTLSAILKYHVVSGEVPASVATTLSSAPTVNGQNITLSVQHGSLYINSSKVVLYDIKTSNGIIHVIDTVLLPN